MSCPRYARTQTWLSYVAPLLVLMLFTLWRLRQHYSSGVFDMFGLYWGARSLLSGGDAYHLHTMSSAAAVHRDPLAVVGNVYPLPANLLTVPIAWMPPTAASCVFVALSLIALTAAMRYSRVGLWPLAWCPLLDAIRVEQPSLLALAAELAAVTAAQRGHHTRLAVLLALASLKPNQTLPLIVVLLWQNRTHWRRHLAAFTLTYLPAFLVQPDWMHPWLAHAFARDADLRVHPVWLLWLLPLLIIPLARRDLLSVTVLATVLAQPYPIPALYPLASYTVGLPVRALRLLSACTPLLLALFAWHPLSAIIAASIIRVLLTVLPAERAHPYAAPAHMSGQVAILSTTTT